MAFALLALAPAARAHPGPHEEIARLDVAIAAEPGRADLHLERAVQYRLASRYDEALADLARAERLAPADPNVYLQRGLTLTEMGRDADADAALTRYLGDGAGNAVALAERGRIRARRGDFEGALADYSAALALEGQVELFLLRGGAQEKLKRLAEAAAGYREGLTQFPGDAALQEALVRVEVERRNFDAALVVVADALARSPQRTRWLLRQGDILELAGRRDEATEARLAALAEIDRVLATRQSAIQLVIRAEVFLALGRLDEAQADLDVVLRKAPHYRAAHDLQTQLVERRRAQGVAGDSAATAGSR